MKYAKGYSLIELAIVLVIISLLLGGAFVAFPHWKEQAAKYGADNPNQEEFGEMMYELKTGKRCPKKGLVKGNGKKIGLLKHCPDTEE